MKLTLQQVFDKIYTHFIIEGNPRSITIEGECRFRGKNGTKCAIGLFIPDEVYEEKMETLGIASLFQNYPTMEDILGDLSEFELSTLQKYHDMALTTAIFRDALKNFAQTRGLTVPVKES